MLSSLIIYFVIYAFFLGLIVLLGFLIQNTKEREYISNDHIALEELVVLIPFRNERDRIAGLLNSINNSNHHPNNYIFINDHSDDNTSEFIEKNLTISNYQILSCPDSYTGKKKAIRLGTENSASKFILTFDADVTFKKNYFTSISTLGEADMYVLPVRMSSMNLLQKFFTIDHLLVTAVNASLAGLLRPIMASGANLLYKRSSFEIADNLESHEHMASGDDTYLLRDFRKQDMNTRLCVDPSTEVVTAAPSSIAEFINQRLRWIGKTQDLKDHLSTVLAVFQSALTIIFLFLIGYFILTSSYDFLILTFFAKAAADMILFLPFFSKRKALVAWLLIPFYEIFFPIYTLVLIILLPFYKPQWKGREI